MITREDFYKLRIGDKVYFEGDECFINYLQIVDHWFRVQIQNKNSIIETIRISNKDEISEFHLTLPKKKERYWIWAVCLSGGIYVQSNSYLNEAGKDTMGCGYHKSWDTMNKEKRENDWIEV